jgi:hypothetical protein
MQGIIDRKNELNIHTAKGDETEEEDSEDDEESEEGSDE